jgi:hypothetical protein
VAVQVGLSAETGKMLVLGHQLVAPPIDPSTGQVQPRPEARCCPAPFARLRVRLRIPTRTVGSRHRSRRNPTWLYFPFVL